MALLLCAIGALRGDASQGLMLIEVTRLPLLLAQALGDSFPADGAQTVLSLSGGQAAPSAPPMVPLDPFLLSGSLALTTQAVQLLPLRGLDGYRLARYVLGPRLVQFSELTTGVLLLLGAFNRLGPNSNPLVCDSALFAWVCCALLRSPLPPREDFDDDPRDSPLLAGLATFLMIVPAAILIPGKLVPLRFCPRQGYDSLMQQPQQHWLQHEQKTVN
eukprot:CAMPEP_0172666752 /NCGR_PEP_ID=MMETSP1074-20121228/8002_1 /TAXON_ID=2916 /ORGANISM="Ceratium fusus, Strain PA161109" /LENGTH=216 /DNA_ID=CAMNT_0013483173 /DNA_START=89 /DNA_END=737 /DNA_ORIENTATION=-